MKPLRRIAFAVNAQKPGAEQLASILSGIAERKGVEALSTKEYPIPAGFLEGYDACCVIGGDGSILSVVHEAVRHSVPVMGVNHGKLGFLANYTTEEAKQSFDQLLEGNYRTSARTLLECQSCDGMASLALNDIVVKNHSTRLVRLQVLANGDLVNEYYADGLIFSTPTGSTAYNLSAGGALIHPAANVISMTPICPHTLSNRSFIFAEERELQVVLCNPEPDILVTRDGKPCIQSPELFPLRIRLAEKKFDLIENPSHSHFDLVREKLRWGSESN